MDPTEELITSFYELNGTAVQELCDGDGVGIEPSPLEFMRHVARNTPFVIRGGADLWPAVTTWSVPVLRKLLAGSTVNVAVTPDGRADAPARLVRADGRHDTVFAKPLEEAQDFGAFLDCLVQQAGESETGKSGETRYAQTQNDNLRHEYAAVFPHVAQDIPFARIALDRAPEAVNLWIGNAHSVTALHRDNYENIYVQVLGQKHFVLLPPVCQPCVNEQVLTPFTYHRTGDGGDGSDGGDGGDGGNQTAARLRLVQDPAPPPDDAPASEGGYYVPFPVWDPDRPGLNTTAYSHLAQPMRVSLGPGDMLYLPAMWYHKVSQSASREGVCVAVNYWYDMDFTGPLVPLNAYVRANHPPLQEQSRR